MGMTTEFVCIAYIFSSYLQWQVLVGLHKTISQSFLLVGQTKFAPDWCFGVLKQKYKKTLISYLADTVDVINSSADINTPQLVGTQNEEVLVPTYSCNSFLGGHHCKVSTITSYHHYTFSIANPGMVTWKRVVTHQVPHDPCVPTTYPVYILLGLKFQWPLCTHSIPCQYECGNLN